MSVIEFLQLATEVGNGGVFDGAVGNQPTGSVGKVGKGGPEQFEFIHG